MQTRGFRRRRSAARVDLLGRVPHFDVSVLDISGGGILVEAETAEAVGTQLLVDIQFEAIGERVPLNGRVVWSTQRRMGIEFDILEDDDAALLGLLIEHDNLVA